MLRKKFDATIKSSCRIMSKERIFFVVLILMFTGAGYYFGNTNCPEEQPAIIAPVEEVITRETRAGGYELINPLVECDCYKPSRQVSTVLLEQNLNNYI